MCPLCFSIVSRRKVLVKFGRHKPVNVRLAPCGRNLHKVRVVLSSSLSSLWPTAWLVRTTIEGGIVESSSTFDSRRSEEHTSELQSRPHLVCRLLLEKKKPT